MSWNNVETIAYPLGAWLCVFLIVSVNTWVRDTKNRETHLLGTASTSSTGHNRARDNSEYGARLLGAYYKAGVKWKANRRISYTTMWSIFFTIVGTLSPRIKFKMSLKIRIEWNWKREVVECAPTFVPSILPSRHDTEGRNRGSRAQHSEHIAHQSFVIRWQDESSPGRSGGACKILLATWTQCFRREYGNSRVNSSCRKLSHLVTIQVVRSY